MRFSDKKVLLFDLDGTLVDSAPDLASALNHMLSSLQRDTFDHDTIRGWVGNGAQVLVKRGLSGSIETSEQLDPELVQDALQLFLDHYAQNLCVDTVCYPNVASTLQTLKERGYRLVLVTNKPYGFIHPLLEGLGLCELFELCLGGDSLSRRKPDPLPLLHVCEQLGVDAEHCLMIGDSKNDIVAASAARMQSVGVSYGYNYGEPIAMHGPDRVVDDFGELLTLLGAQT